MKIPEAVKQRIETYAQKLVPYPKLKKMYENAYPYTLETALEECGDGTYSLIDDANIPSLLSIPYIGYADVQDEVYQNTRRFLLSKENPFYFEGKYAKGIGSRHTPEHYVWHMALVMQGMTSVDADEKREVLDMLVRTDADTGYLHEGFHVDNPQEFTREWFTWPNSLFCEFVERCIDEKVI